LLATNDVQHAPDNGLHPLRHAQTSASISDISNPLAPTRISTSGTFIAPVSTSGPSPIVFGTRKAHFYIIMPSRPLRRPQAPLWNCMCGRWRLQRTSACSLREVSLFLPEAFKATQDYFHSHDQYEQSGARVDMNTDMTLWTPRNDRTMAFTSGDNEDNGEYDSMH
jgi:hypothetical protein